MTTIKQWDKATCRRVLVAAMEALKPVQEEFGISIELKGGGNFTDGTLTKSLTFNVVSSDGVTAEWKANCRRFGLYDEDYGRKFESKGKGYTVSGIKPRSPKFPVLATDADGTVYKFRIEGVRRLLGRTSDDIDLFPRR